MSDTGQTSLFQNAYRFHGCWAMRNSSSIIERPMCLTCKHRMGLARISPGKRGFEEHTFECRTCHRIEKVSFAIDPMKTAALTACQRNKKSDERRLAWSSFGRRRGNTVELMSKSRS